MAWTFVRKSLLLLVICSVASTVQGEESGKISTCVWAAAVQPTSSPQMPAPPNPAPSPATAPAAIPADPTISSPVSSVGGTAGFASTAMDPSSLQSGCEPRADYGCGGDCGANGCPPQWTAEAGPIILSRNYTRGPLLLSDPLAGTLFRSSDMTFSYEVGSRVSLIHHSDDWDIEANYFSVDGWDGNSQFPNSAIPSSVGTVPLDKAIQLPVYGVNFGESTRLYSGELNARRAIQPWFTILGGLRWVELEDDYNASGTENVLGTQFNETIKAHNHLFGVQSGFDATIFEFRAEQRFQLHTIGKAGVFYNAASQGTTLTDPAGLGNFSANAESSHGAFLGEIGLLGSWEINKHFALRGGYEVIYLQGVALGPRQLNTTDLTGNTAGVDTVGSLLFHGINASLEVTW